MPFNFFKKKKPSRLVEGDAIQVVPIKSLDYPPKIILAWAKAVEGKQEFLDWLRDNGYPELHAACAAIKLNEKSRIWLMDNGYPHLLAFIQAAESKKAAMRWLENNNFHLLIQMAKAIDGDKEALLWIQKNQPVDIYILTMAIKVVKDDIEDYNNDVHIYK